MEQLNYPAEGFFANGFHQFYNELNGELVYESTLDFGAQIFNNCDTPVKSFDGVWTVDENSSNDLFYEELTSSTYFKVEPNGTDLIDLDQFLSFDAGNVSFLDPFDSLPEKTFMCSDSCNLFLKESSENLKLNSLKLQQQGNQISEASEVAEEKPVFPCEYGDCQKVYAKPAHLRAHLRRHLGEKPYICTWPECTWRFSRSDELARHIRSHSGVKNYKCDFCIKTFSRSDHLTKHRRVHERKMAASKVKIVWQTLPKGKPGRKPNSFYNKTSGV